MSPKFPYRVKINQRNLGLGLNLDVCEDYCVSASLAFDIKNFPEWSGLTEKSLDPFNLVGGKSYEVMVNGCSISLIDVVLGQSFLDEDVVNLENIAINDVFFSESIERRDGSFGGIYGGPLHLHSRFNSSNST